MSRPNHTLSCATFATTGEEIMAVEEGLLTLLLELAHRLADEPLRPEIKPSARYLLTVSFVEQT